MLEIEETNSVRLIKKRAIDGVFYLGLRRFVVQIIQTISNIVLARILFPSDFGLFAIVYIYLTFFTHISDIGLSASLIQKAKTPRTRQLRSIFTLHLLFGIASLILMILLTPVFNTLFSKQLGSVGYKLLLFSSVVPLFYNFRLVSQSLLERTLDYKRLVIGEMFELIIQQIVTVLFAVVGFGAGSFVAGLIFSRLAGSIGFLLLRKWKIGIGFNYRDIRPLIPFGLHYQLNTLVGLISGSLAPFVVGGLMGTHALGLVNWAAGVASFPRALGEIVGRVIFPLGARMQNDKKSLGRAFSKVLEITNIVSLPALALTVALSSPITYIVFTSRWSQGIVLLYFFGLHSFAYLFGSYLNNCLLALGESKLVRNISFFWVILQWVLTIPLVKIFGPVGFPIAATLVYSTLIISLVELKKRVKISIVATTAPYLLYASIVGAFVYYYSVKFPIESMLELLLVSVFGILAYLVFVLIFNRGRVRILIQSLMFNFFGEENKDFQKLIYQSFINLTRVRK